MRCDFKRLIKIKLILLNENRNRNYKIIRIILFSIIWRFCYLTITILFRFILIYIAIFERNLCLRNV